MSYSFFDVSNCFNSGMPNLWGMMNPIGFNFNSSLNMWNPFVSVWNNYFMPNMWNNNFWNSGIWSFNNANNYFLNNSNVDTFCTTCSNSLKNNYSITTSSDTPATNSKSTTTQSTNYNNTDNKRKMNDCFCNYNVDTGEKLAKIALKNHDRFHNQCATHVQNAIAEAGLGTSPNVDAYEMFDVLRQNSNFEEISTENVKLDEIPAGCVLVYDKGVPGASKKYGHIEIALGDGRAASDGITDKIKHKPTALFVPIA